VLNLLLQTFNSELGYVGYINSDGDLVCPTLTRQVWDQCQIPDKTITFPKKSWGGLWGQSLLERRSLIANEKLRSPVGHLSLENAMAVPLINHDRVIGQFVLANKKGGYSSRDLELAENAATQTAPILQSLLDKTEQQRLKSKLDRVNRELHKIESLNRMAGAIAHNYNNLLTVVMGGIEMALEVLPDNNDRVRNSLNYALQASSKGGEIGQMLLMYLGQTKGNEVIVDTLQVTKEFLHKYTKEINSAVTIEFNPPEQSPVISVDPKHIDKILSNIFTNAIESQTPEDSPVTLNIFSASPESIFANQCFPMEWRPLDESYVCFEVRDHGCGIDSKNIEKLFDPYYSDKFTGRGMGLAIVHGIVQIYNGVITVESMIGKGSTFRIYLPIFTEYARKNL
jgi:signal transduction histidine kinase